MPTRIISLLELSRWKNVVFISGLLLFTYIFILRYSPVEAGDIYPYLGLLTLSTALIAAGGYLINDYFDTSIDRINRPERAVRIQKLGGKRHLIIWHIVFSLIGLIIAVYCALEMGKLRLSFYQVFCVIVLFFYSFTFKKIALAGNLIIAFLSVLNLWLLPSYAYNALFIPNLYHLIPHPFFEELMVISVFAFSMTLLREIVKDTEDLKGDIINDCKTLPILIGVQKTKIVIFILSLIILILFMYYYSPLITINSLSLISYVVFISLLIFTIILIFKSKTTQSFKEISRWIKLLMLLGLGCSLFFLYL